MAKKNNANKNNGSSKQNYSTTTKPSKPVDAYCGFLEVVPGNSSQRISKPDCFAKAMINPGNSSTSCQMISKQNTVDKQTGNYGRYTKKETASTGQIHRELGKGAVGVRNEYKKATTYKVGNKTAYTEYYKEERVRHVSYDKSLVVTTKNVVSKVGNSSSSKATQRNYNHGGAGDDSGYGYFY